jgi:hypothetical protein
MSSAAGMRVVGTIRSIELHTVEAKFQNVASRQVARLTLDLERATGGDGVELDLANLVDLRFQGPAELVPAYAVGERVQVTTAADNPMHIDSIKRSPLS